MPEILEADAVVVGGGPAGSAAAEAILRNRPSANVVVLERLVRPQGTCAGGVGWHWLEEMDLKLPSHIIETEIHDVVVHGPTETAEIHRDDLGVQALGYIIDRWGFDQWLLARVEGLGANVLRKTAFKSIAKEGGRWTVTAGNQGGDFKIRAPYVVDASGPGAVVAKQLGMTINEDDSDIHVGLQWTIPIPDHVPLQRLEMWFQRDPTRESQWAAPTGYVWSFASRHPYWDGANPVKAGRYTRLGVGVDRAHNRDPATSAKACLQAFRRTHPDFAGEVVSENGGLIPTGKTTHNAHDGVFVVGDAGRHVSALHGGGIYFGRVAGEEAGRAIANGASDAEFERAWQKRVGLTLRLHVALKRVIYDVDNAGLDAIVSALSEFRPESANPVAEMARAAKVVAKHPKLAGKASVAAVKALLAR